MREKVKQWFQFKRYNWRNYDISLVVTVFILSLISVYVLSIVQGGHFSIIRSVFSIIAGLFIVAFFSLIDYHDLCRYIPLLYIIATLMVAATKLSPLGDDQHTNSYRWLDFKFMEFQPSEICKIVVILTLATFLYRSRENLKTFRNFFIASALAFVPTFFILIQSDLSSSVVIIVILVMMLACSGIGYRILGTVAAVVVPVMLVCFWYILHLKPDEKFLFIKPYQLERITGWLHPEGNELGIMYQQNNSVLSIASGKLYGKLLDGNEATRNYTNVDVTESDFIWTPIREEFGFLGCMLILLLLSIIIIKCFLAAKNAKDYLGMMIAVGIGSMFCFQVFFNIGVTTSLLPNTGLPLPFLSNGMSSLLSNMMTIGILLNIGIQPNRGNSSIEIH